MASVYNHLGLQDVEQKQQGPSQTPGPWAGSTVTTGNDAVCLTIPVEYWNKAKGMVTWLHQQLISGSLIYHATLESYRGTLVYISQTYPSLTPYLKGIHLPAMGRGGNCLRPRLRLQLDQH